ncbi:Transcriptional regulatory protein ros [Methylobacterium crusticola]|uniref:Transcriptional regulatory protein ros n=1 Tax=Methylobacterium crusticola TaxID=1697972 RepID=A0ABQ4R737_9HYPH|nr:MucR family transcriptional regulator [Methylobacterium crusticola]GJD52985.1 Transcriptional regulatory protein ros [Methylobacterium crusticola]
MSENEPPDTALIDLTADVISAYVSNNTIRPTDLPDLIASVHASLATLAEPAAPAPEKLTPPVPIRKTITPDHIISLEDGKPYKSLKRHLSGRGLTADEYRRKWGLPHDYPMVATNYAAARSELAKSFGFGKDRRKAAE